MSKIFFTSDTHFNHDKDFIWGARGYNSVEEMNNAIVTNWNSVVNPEDTVYLLGDCMLGDDQAGLKLLNMLNGNIYIAIGNHDTDSRIRLYRELPHVKDIQMAYRIKKGKTSIILSHYPTITANGKENHVFNLCGHNHTKDPFSDWEKYRSYHVEMDAHNCTPIEIEEIMKKIKEKKESLKNG